MKEPNRELRSEIVKAPSPKAEAQPAAEALRRKHDMNWNENKNWNKSLDEVAEKMKAQNQTAQSPLGYEPAQCGQAVAGTCGCDARRPSLREEAEKSVASHYEKAAKAERSLAFFRDHPEFDEFIQLIRSGVIGI